MAAVLSSALAVLSGQTNLCAGRFGGSSRQHSLSSHPSRTHVFVLGAGPLRTMGPLDEIHIRVGQQRLLPVDDGRAAKLLERLLQGIWRRLDQSATALFGSNRGVAGACSGEGAHGRRGVLSLQRSGFSQHVRILSGCPGVCFSGTGTGRLCPGGSARLHQRLFFGAAAELGAGSSDGILPDQRYAAGILTGQRERRGSAVTVLDDARKGYSVVDVTPITITPAGVAAPSANQPNGETAGVAIQFTDPRLGLRTLRFFSLNLQDSRIQRKPGTLRHFPDPPGGEHAGQIRVVLDA